VDDHLVSLPRRAGIDAVVERGLSDEGQGVRLLLLHRRFREHLHAARFGGNARRAFRARALVQGFASGVQRLNHHSADLRR